MKRNLKLILEGDIMKKRGVTLVELIVVIALLGIVLPLAFNIYLGESRIAKNIKTNIDVQQVGGTAINEINKDFSSAEQIYSDYNEVDKKFPEVNVDTNVITISGVEKYRSLFYIETLGKNAVIYATTRITTDPAIVVDEDIYKLTVNSTADTGIIYKYMIDTTDTNPANLQHIIIDDDSVDRFKKDGSIANEDFGVDNFENIVLYNKELTMGRIERITDLKRNKVKIKRTDDHGKTIDDFIVMGYFKDDSGSKYVYYKTNTGDEKYFGKLSEHQVDYVPECTISSEKPILENVNNFTNGLAKDIITNSDITYQIKCNLKNKDGKEYPFNVDVNPLYLGGGK
jgi:prepilin-type N-terminal cleavage/methylation domain-containing protein